ncbi:MAG: TetR/AcrR family transcriptional regulator [Actinomycetota bacterium]|nr:TetR/AcrR family transcriptional regulator [Actinomycetota bacterium]
MIRVAMARLGADEQPDEAAGHAQRMPKERRRQLLIDQARVHFAAKGFHATSMQDIAAAAGVTKPVIYQHFSSKRSLYLDLLGITGEEMCGRIRTATANSQSVHQQVIAGFDSFFRFAYENRSGYELLFASGPRRDPEFQGALSEIEDELADLVTSTIEVPISETHRRFIALGVIALAEGTLRRWLRELDLSGAVPTDYEATSGPMWSRRIAELAWAGLRGIQADELDGDSPG